jgi:hypothetical protein
MGMTPYLRYDSKHQSLFVSGWINYVGGLWSSLYGIQNNKLVQQRFAVEYSDPTDGIYYKTGNTAASAKSVSKSQLASYTKSYMNDWKEYKMYENTSANRTKYIK